MRLVPRLILALFAAAPLLAQPAFDVASVKPSVRAGDTIDINLGSAAHGIVTLTNTTLSECIRYAYSLVSEDQISGPDWIHDRSLRVDITAKAPPDTPSEQLLAMLQALLKERFRLVLHHDMKRIAHFDLTVASTGPKLQETAGDTPAFTRTYNTGRLSYSHISMNRFAVLLSRQLREPVLDNTGLHGFYDINLEWTPDEQLSQAAPKSDAPLHPGIANAIQQLGLKLERSKTPLDVLVIDSAEKIPVAN